MAIQYIIHPLHVIPTTIYKNKNQSIKINVLCPRRKIVVFFNNFTKEQNSCVIKCNTGNDVEPNFKEL